MNVALPSELVKAISLRLEGVSRKALAERASVISARYRKGGTSRDIACDADALAYLTTRVPASYAAIAGVFGALRNGAPDFAPRSLLDAGAGPGVASWAAAEMWPSVGTITMLDRNPAFLALARELASASSSSVLAKATVVAGDIASSVPSEKAELVVASYVLAEFSEDRIEEVARALWMASSNMLVLTEPGTPEGFLRVRLAREALRKEGAHLVVPCTHDRECPMGNGDWCHFSQRLPRSRDHMLVKSAYVPFEDERYCYAVLSRERVAQRRRARIIAPVRTTRGSIELPTCDSDGALKTNKIARRDKECFATARRLGWGDAI